MSDPLYHIARYRDSIGDLEEAETLHREAYWLASLNPNTMRSYRYLTMRGMCDILQQMGKHRELRRFIDKELNGPHAVKGVDAQELAARRIMSYMETGEFEPAIKELSATPPEHSLISDPKSLLCRGIFEAGRFDEANAIMPVALHFAGDDYLPREAPSFEVQLRRLARHHDRPTSEVEASVPKDAMERDRSGVVPRLRELALKRMQQRDFTAAAEYLREAEEIASRRMSTVDRVFVDLVYDAAILKLAAGEAPEALAEVRRATEAARARYPKGSITLAEFLHQSGMLAMYARDLPTARGWIDESIAIRAKLWSGVNVRVWNPILDRIEATPDPNERREFLRDQIRQMSNQGVSSWRVAVLLRELGATQSQLGAYSDAERSLVDAWKVLSPMLGEKHPLTKSTTTELAKVCVALGKSDEAEKWRKLAAQRVI